MDGRKGPRNTIAYDMTNQLWKQVRDIAEMVIITALVVVFVRNVAITYTVNGPSMEPTFLEDHRVLVNRFGAIRFWGISLYGQQDFLFEGPERGDIIVFEPQQPGTEKIVKRVVGLPGDKVDISNGIVEVNEIGTNYSEDFTETKSHLDYPLVVPPDNYFVLGDNRSQSNDSRNWGYVPTEDIVGKVWMLYWPWQQISVY